MKRTDKEIIEAMTFIKNKHNGELPYQFGTFECAKMMVGFNSKFLLLEALEDLVKYCEENDTYAELDLAYDAINKAKGL